MEVCHRNVLRRCNPHIRENISVDKELLYSMIAEEILSHGDGIWENQDGKPREPEERADKLLSLLPSRGRTAFEIFIASLKESQTRVNNELADYLLRKVSVEKKASSIGSGANPSASLDSGEDEVDSNVTPAPTTQAHVVNMSLSAEADTSRPPRPGAAAAQHPTTPAGVAVTSGNTAIMAWPVQAQTTAGHTVTGTALPDPAVATAARGQTAAPQAPNGEVQSGQSGIVLRPGENIMQPTGQLEEELEELRNVVDLEDLAEKIDGHLPNADKRKFAKKLALSINEDFGRDVYVNLITKYISDHGSTIDGQANVQNTHGVLKWAESQSPAPRMGAILTALTAACKSNEYEFRHIIRNTKYKRRDAAAGAAGRTS